MKNLVLLAFVLIFYLSNSSAQQSHNPMLSYNDTATIKIIAENITDTVIIHSTYFSMVPQTFYNYNKVEISKPGTYYMKFALTKPGSCNFYDYTFHLFIIPGDTTVVKLNTKTDENKKLIVDIETTAVINNYFRAKSKQQNSSNHFNKFFNPNKESINISEYVEASKITDSIVKLKHQFLDNYATTLPDWFYKTEKIDITYGYANQLFQLYLRLNEGARALVPMSFVQLKNPEAILSEAYYDFLHHYLYFNFPVLNNKLNGTLLSINNIERQAQLVDSILEGEMKEYYLTCELSDLYTVAKTLDEIKIADNYIKTNYPKLPEANFKFINSQRNRMMKSIKTGLQKGNKAPGFYLKDVNGKQYNLSNFSSKAIYINFWATDSEPCLKEIQNVNKLKAKLSNKPVEIINICMDSNPEKWKQIIEKEKLTGINLICAGNWKDKLKEFYFIDALPQYALIDKNGLIATNKCVGPADIYQEIKKLIDNK